MRNLLRKKNQMIEFLTYVALSTGLALAGIVFLARDVGLWKSEDDWQDDETC
jgi:hypothetical protein